MRTGEQQSAARRLADWLEDQYDPTHNQTHAAVMLLRQEGVILDMMLELANIERTTHDAMTAVLARRAIERTRAAMNI